MKNLQKLLNKLAEKIYFNGEGKDVFTAVEEEDVRIEVEYTMWLDDDYITFKSFDIIHYLEDDCEVREATVKEEDEVINEIKEMAA